MEGLSASDKLPVCIIGAGSSGVACAKALLQKGVSFECLEMGSKIGGMWRYQNDNGLSAAYRSLHIDTSRKNLGYPDFPIPDKYPDYLSHCEVLEYLESYADHFGVMPHIRFNSTVQRIEPMPAAAAATGERGEPVWRVTLKDGSRQFYRAIIVANGHLWNPRHVSFEGEFDGMVLHAHQYRTAEPFRDRRVLVVGFGNSAVDIAVDVCKTTSKTFISTRRGAWIMPKYVLGYPQDQVSAWLARTFRLSTRQTRSIMQKLARLTMGDQGRFGFPRPAHEIWREHATLSQELLSYAGHGWIRAKPNVRRLQGGYIEFDDGSVEAIDVMIQATGYRPIFPFLDPELFEVRDGEPLRLYRRMVSPDHPGLYFAGLVQPIGPTIPLVEIQARWLAYILADDLVLPDQNVMQGDIDAHYRQIQQQYVGTARYTLEVDFRSYARQLKEDMQQSRAQG